MFTFFLITFFINFHFIPAKSFSLLSKVLINLDLSIVGCTFYYFFQCEIILAFTLLLICFVYKYQLNILNGRFSRSVEFIKGGNRSKMCQQFKPRKLSAHLTSHHSIIAAFDYLNRDIVSKAIASVMIFLTPYNIDLVTTFLISTKSGSSTAYSELILIDKTGLVFSLVYQLFLVILMAVSFCFLVDSLHGSAREMHGLQLWLISRSNNEKEVVKNCNKLDVSLTLKWKLAFHYEVVHTVNESRHNFTVGPLVLTKRSAVEVKLVIIPICVLIFIT